MAEAASSKRVAFSPGEFAALFGKSQTWGYRQIYAGKVKAITQHGRILIPAKEVERVLESAGIYNGREKPKQAKARIEKLSPEQKSIWQRFLASRRQPSSEKVMKGAANKSPHSASKWPAASRKSVLGRIAQSWGGRSSGR
jgi:hypothetical protein